MKDHSFSPPEGESQFAKDLALARECLSRLSSSRAEDRDSWIKVGMVLQSISDELLLDWIEFSRRSDKFRAGECEKLWRGFKPNKPRTVGLGSLIQWAREDSGDAKFGQAKEPSDTQSFETLERAIAFLEQQTRGTQAGLWRYELPEGSAWFWIVRLDLPIRDKKRKRDKTFRPIRIAGDRFEIGDPPGLLPLYRLPLLPSEGPINVVEGEKPADAGVQIGMETTTSAHGANSAARTSWNVLAGRHVRVFPDADASGLKYARAVAEICLNLDPPAIVQIVMLPELPEGGDLHDFVALRRAPWKSDEEILAEIELLAERTPAEEKPQTSRTDRRKAPGRKRVPKYIAFPTPLLPEPMRGFVLRASDAIGCDPAFIALPLLAAAASAIGNTRRILLKRGWPEPCIIWALLIGLSGDLKSPALGRILRLIDELQRRALRDHEEEVRRYKVKLDAFEVRRGKWVKAGGVGDAPERPDEPIAERLYASDATIEALAPLLKNRWRGLLLIRDELSGWVDGFNQYRQGKGGDAAYWLEMHGGRPILIDRKTSEPKTIHVPYAAVSITGGIQPRVLARALGNEHFENGLAARFLLAYPPRRDRRWTDADIPEQDERDLLRVLERLYGLREDKDPDGTPTPRDVELTPDAKKLWIGFFNEHGEQQATMTGNLSAAWSKLEGYAARLALVIHYLRWAGGDVPDDPRVDAGSIKAGIELSRWFGNEAKRVYAILRESEEEEADRALVEVIRRKGSEVTVRGWQRLRTHATATEAETELQRLVDAGLGTWVHDKPGPQGGRPSKRFQLHPEEPEPETPNADEPEGDSSVSEDKVGADASKKQRNEETAGEGARSEPTPTSETTPHGDEADRVSSVSESQSRSGQGEEENSQPCSQGKRSEPPFDETVPSCSEMGVLSEQGEGTIPNQGDENSGASPSSHSPEVSPEHHSDSARASDTDRTPSSGAADGVSRSSQGIDEFAILVEQVFGRPRLDGHESPPQAPSPPESPSPGSESDPAHPSKPKAPKQTPSFEGMDEREASHD